MNTINPELPNFFSINFRQEGKEEAKQIVSAFCPDGTHEVNVLFKHSNNFHRQNAVGSTTLLGGRGHHVTIEREHRNNEGKILDTEKVKKTKPNIYLGEGGTLCQFHKQAPKEKTSEKATETKLTGPSML